MNEMVLSENDYTAFKYILKMCAAMIKFGSRKERKETRRALEMACDWLEKKYGINDLEINELSDKAVTDINTEPAPIRPDNTIPGYEKAVAMIEKELMQWR